MKQQITENEENLFSGANAEVFSVIHFTCVHIYIDSFLKIVCLKMCTVCNDIGILLAVRNSQK